MNIIVTGGAGFIGSWITEAYIGEGHKVLIIDNLSTGNIDNVPNEAEFIEADICDLNKIKNIFARFKPDVVNHHAAQVNVRYSVENPSSDALINIIGSVNVIQESKNNVVKKIIFSSSGGAVYGEPTLNPVSEIAVTNPLSPYGTAKQCVENYLMHYHSLYGIEYIALRYANVYGERQSPHGEAGVIGIFCNNIIQGSECKIFGYGEQTKDYVHFSDVVNANLLSLKKNISGKFNIGTSVESSVNKVASYLGDVCEREIKISHIEKKTGEVSRICLDYTKAKEELEWFPKVDLKSGIKKTWNWFINK